MKRAPAHCTSTHHWHERNRTHGMSFLLIPNCVVCAVSRSCVYPRGSTASQRVLFRTPPNLDIPPFSPRSIDITQVLQDCTTVYSYTYTHLCTHRRVVSSIKEYYRYRCNYLDLPLLVCYQSPAANHQSGVKTVPETETQ